MTNFMTPFLSFEKLYFMRIVCRQRILMKYTLIVIFEKMTKFEIVMQLLQIIGGVLWVNSLLAG